MCVYMCTHRFVYVLNHIVLKKKLKFRGIRRLFKGFMFTCNKRGISDLPNPRLASLLRLCPESQLYLREKNILRIFVLSLNVTGHLLFRMKHTALPLFCLSYRMNNWDGSIFFWKIYGFIKKSGTHLLSTWQLMLSSVRGMFIFIDIKTQIYVMINIDYKFDTIKDYVDDNPLQFPVREHWD